MKTGKLKILIIRFSSIGDIIYTTPVIRCIRQQLPEAEVHYLTKKKFSFLLENNPYINRLHLLDGSLSEIVNILKKEKFDFVIDLHNTLRSTLVKLRLGIKASTFKKERIKKWLAIRFKYNLVKPIHLVDRYLKTVEFLGVKNDNKPIDYFLPAGLVFPDIIPQTHKTDFIVFIIGATHFTKRMPNEKIISLCKSIHKPIILLGGSDVAANGALIRQKVGANVFSACGELDFNQSVQLVKNAVKVIGFDTGLTHIAEAFNKEIVSIWGSTVPELLGVQPYHVKHFYEAGVELECRPCSKFGLEKCPLGHFKCMWDIDENKIADFVN